MAEISLIPYAPALVESMRAMGYSLESAVADLVDNSITAGATSIRGYFHPIGNPYMALLDDGIGMSADELTEAMRHGARNPLLPREPSDLGRFGLGLNTAALSQCRKLTVVSMKANGGSPIACCWDLDLINRRADWILHVLDSIEEIRALPHYDQFASQGHGTLVVWEKLDRLTTGETGTSQAFDEKVPLLREHLSLVFHRYIAGEDGIKGIQISLNDEPLESADPFFTKNKATQRLYTESFQVNGSDVTVTPYILPHISKLRQKERERVAESNWLRSTQGFYVYRNRRLIHYGTWFRIAHTEELTKLARVQVDIPNELDYLWALDIKKSTAYPPIEVRSILKRTAERIVAQSRGVFRYRGRNSSSKEIIHTWNRIETRTGVQYRLNRDHPAISRLVNDSDGQRGAAFKAVLELIESTYPLNAMYHDMSTDRAVEDQTYGDAELRILATQLLKSSSRHPDKGEAFQGQIEYIEPFSRNRELVRLIVKEYKDAQQGSGPA